MLSCMKAMLLLQPALQSQISGIPALTFDNLNQILGKPNLAMERSGAIAVVVSPPTALMKTVPYIRFDPCAPE
jgi:hypothetical protein